MKVELSPEIERLVQESLAAGRYSSESELVCEAIRLIAERDRLVSAQQEALKRDIQAGIDQLNRGEWVEVNAQEVIASIRKRLGEQR